jgi:hypothetical protein
MKLGKIVELWRLAVDDTVQPYLWSDSEAIAYAVDAENEACRRARLLIDSSTSEICQLAVTAGDVSKTLDPRVIFIRRAIESGKTMPLARYNMRDLDECRLGWESNTGTIDGLVTDWETGKVRLYRIPTANTVINMTVVRLPLTDMNDLEDTPEINARFHEGLINWMIYRAYMKPDKETYDATRANTALEIFEGEFGRKSGAEEEEWISRQFGADPFDGSDH